MKYRSVMNNHGFRRMILASGILLLTTLSARSIELPVSDTPGNWVNDYARVFTNEEAQLLNQKLQAFQNSTSTQIFIVTINENNGYPASVLAPEIGEKWQVGQQGKDNGLLILMDMQGNEVFISTGYGLEEFIPDAIAKRIVEKEILPRFREDNFFGGIDEATTVLISLLEGKFTADEYREQTSGSPVGSAIGGFLFFLFWMLIIFGSRRRSVGIGGKSSLPFWIALGMLNSASGRGGSFGNFSSGRGGFGGGGFGGFSGGGGGSFGGGGAGGRW